MQASTKETSCRKINKDHAWYSDGDDFAVIGGMVGDCPAMRDLFAMLPKLAATKKPVIIRGESGTGKAMIARAIHELSSRKCGPYVAVNCATLPEGFAHAELFRQLKPMSSDAARQKIGRFHLADGGTVLLDDIAELPYDGQARLLQYLQVDSADNDHDDYSLEVDVRIVASTQVDLEDAVLAGTFREDLYHRLNVLSVDVPPLRDRAEDIQLLADHFFQRYTNDDSRYRLMDFSFDARLALYQWHWPGNVLELANRIQRAIIMCDGGPISRTDLGLERRSRPRRSLTLDEVRDEAEKRAVLNALDSSVGNVTAAAELLGICRMTLYRLIEKHGISRSAG